jgi:DNA-binding response OmpR family regulator
LVIDDERAIRDLLRDYLRKSNYRVSVAANGEDALELFYKDKIDLIVLDIMMKKMNGHEVLRHIRERADCPVIMLTARDDEESELRSFQLNADDYVTKPFSAKTLLARIEALLRRHRRERLQSSVGILEYHYDLYDVTWKGQSLSLGVKEFELFSCFLRNKGLLLSREQILDQVWGFHYEGGLRTVDAYIKSLRKKLPKEANYIRTVRGVGYRFEVPE